jgi:hypothetical protein
MPEYFTPGVYIEERSGPRPIEGVGTAVAAFIGFAPAGPKNEPVLITSWPQYVATFGREEKGVKNPHLPGAYLSHAVAGYFLNGGGRCYVTRIVPDEAAHQPYRVEATMSANGQGDLFTVRSRTLPQEDIAVTIRDVKPATDGQVTPGRYTLTVTPVDDQGNPTGEPEEYPNFTDRLDTLNDQSRLISIELAPQARSLTPEERIPRAAKGQITAAPADQTEMPPHPRRTEIAREAKRSPLFLVTAKDPAGPALMIEVIEDTPPKTTPPSGGRFTLEVKMGDLTEQIEDVSLGTRSNIAEVVRRRSKLIDVALPDTLDPDTLPPANQHIVLHAPRIVDLDVQTEHLTGSADGRSGVAGLKIAENVTMVCCPDLMSAYQSGLIDRDGVKAVQQAMIAHCEDPYRRDRIAILDPPPDVRSAHEVVQWRTEEANYDSPFAALYYPWITIIGPDEKRLDIPPCGYIAGIYARNDRERGVHKAPANEVVQGVVRVQPITHEDQAELNPEGINCIRAFTGRGIRVWGARTLSSDPQWRYVNVRRLFNYVEKSIERDMQWVVFEPNNQDLWERVKRDIAAFLTSTWRQGMLFGRSPAEAFFVLCDESNNPDDERDQGRLFVDIGLAAVKPAEFVVFRFRQVTAGSE